MQTHSDCSSSGGSTALFNAILVNFSFTNFYPGAEANSEQQKRGKNGRHLSTKRDRVTANKLWQTGSPGGLNFTPAAPAFDLARLARGRFYVQLSREQSAATGTKKREGGK